VYIREAHALDSAAPGEFGLVEDPIDLAERSDLAHTCMDELDLPMPALVDGLDDKVGLAYDGWPDRLYVIGKDGKIAFVGGKGPRGLDPEAWAKAIAAEVEKGADRESSGPTDK
jgi:hypothetical protein